MKKPKPSRKKYKEKLKKAMLKVSKTYSDNEESGHPRRAEEDGDWFYLPPADD